MKKPSRRNKHNLSHFRNSSCRMGQLVPIGAIEVLRGDTFKHNTNMFMRMSPQVNPVMHPVHTHIHHYYVPMRLLWDKWEDFITGGEDFSDASVVPTINFSSSPVEAGDLANHLGLPVGYSGTANAFLFRAYNLIYNEIYRDQQLQDEAVVSSDSGADSTTETDLLNANWGKDPFTTARPDDQLGSAVSLPLGDQAPVTGIGFSGSPGMAGAGTVRETDGDVAYGSNERVTAQTSVSFKNNGLTGTSARPEIYADLSAASGADLNDLRLAIATQQWQELINQSGNRYQDYLGRYGISNFDARLQLPEYLAGGKQTVQFSEVLQTAEGDDPVGSLKGHAIAALRSNNYMKFFKEDGFVITLMHTKPIPMYMEAVHKMWTRRTKEQFYQKEYEVLGMQEVLNQEVQHDHSEPDGLFGYAPRFEDYRRIPNTIHGDFATTLKDWHMARFFDGNDVALNPSFITCNPTDRIFADQTEDAHHLYLTVQHKLSARRIVSKYHKPSGLTL
ncbi:MAG: hypothetical protein KTR28_02225 [Micavibrio sp.]|nr:hypothetical protein [Micavibrio sp.]